MIAPTLRGNMIYTVHRKTLGYKLNVFIQMCQKGEVVVRGVET